MQCRLSPEGLAWAGERKENLCQIPSSFDWHKIKVWVGKKWFIRNCLSLYLMKLPLDELNFSDKFKRKENRGIMKIYWKYKLELYYTISTGVEKTVICNKTMARLVVQTSDTSNPIIWRQNLCVSQEKFLLLEKDVTQIVLASPVLQLGE